MDIEVIKDLVAGVTKEERINSENMMSVRPIDQHGAWCQMRIKSVDGYCHYPLHKGHLTQKLCKKHDCVNKDCKYFTLYPVAQYWLEYIRCYEAKLKEQQEKKLIKMVNKYHDDSDVLLLNLYNEAAALLGERVLFVQANRIQTPKIIHYVIAKGLTLSKSLRFLLSGIDLRPIIDIDGHEVTLDEFLARKGVKL